MENIHIKFAGIDEKAGVIFLQFATDETLQLIDQAIIYGFSPQHYQVYEMEKLLPLMAEFGDQMLYQEAASSSNKFNVELSNTYNQLTGTIQTVEINSFTAKNLHGKTPSCYLDLVENPNREVDQIRNIVLEILAEEGLILGKVK